MKCRICGARLSTEGDICTDCYKELLDEKELEKDTKERYVLHRKYKIDYDIVNAYWVLIAAILMLVVGVLEKQVLLILFAILFYCVCMGVYLAIDKALAKAQKITFYETKAVYSFKSSLKFFNREKTVKYEDIKEIRVEPYTLRQKRHNMADIIIYTDDIVGVAYFKGIRMRNVEDPETVLTEVGFVTNMTRK